MTGSYVADKEVTADVPPASPLLSNTPLSQVREEHWAPGRHSDQTSPALYPHFSPLCAREHKTPARF